MSVIRWPRHRMISTTPPYDSLGGCSVCGGWEGEVPTDCPGVEMTEEQRAAVMDGQLDYIWREGWITTVFSGRMRYVNPPHREEDS